MTVARQIGVATRLDGIRDQSARCNNGKPQDDAGNSRLPHAGRNRGIATVAVDETTQPRHRNEREAKTGAASVGELLTARRSAERSRAAAPGRKPGTLALHVTGSRRSGR